MLYYKLVHDNEFIGVATSYDLVKFQQKHRILLSCDERYAEYIQHNDSLYRDNWMKPTSTDTIEYTDIDVHVIQEDEYTALLDAIESGENIEIVPGNVVVDDEDDAQEDVGFVAVVKNKSETLEKIEALQSALADIQSQTSELLECIMEMSEVIYS